MVRKGRKRNRRGAKTGEMGGRERVEGKQKGREWKGKKEDRCERVGRGQKGKREGERVIEGEERKKLEEKVSYRCMVKGRGRRGGKREEIRGGDRRLGRGERKLTRILCILQRKGERRGNYEKE